MFSGMHRIEIEAYFDDGARVELRLESSTKVKYKLRILQNYA